MKITEIFGIIRDSLLPYYNFNDDMNITPIIVDIKNLKDGNFKGDLYVANPKEDEVQGIKSFKNPNDLPQVDMAIIAIAAKFCPDTVRLLAEQKNTKAFIILKLNLSSAAKKVEVLAKKADIERQIDLLFNLGASFLKTRRDRKRGRNKIIKVK